VSTDTRAAYKSFSDLRFAREPRPSSSFQPAARTCALLAPTYFYAALYACILRLTHARTHAERYHPAFTRLHAFKPSHTSLPSAPTSLASHRGSRTSVRPSAHALRVLIPRIYGKNHLYTLLIRSSRVRTPGNVSRHIRAAYMTSPAHFHSNSPSCACPRLHPRLRTRQVTHRPLQHHTALQPLCSPPEPPYTRLARRSLEDGSRSDTEKQGKAPRTVGKTRTWYAPANNAPTRRDTRLSPPVTPGRPFLHPLRPRRTPRHTDASNSFRVSRPCRPLRR